MYRTQYDAEGHLLGDEWSYCNPGHAGFHERFCKNKFPDAYTITYWSHTWGGPETPAVASTSVAVPVPAPKGSPPSNRMKLWG